MSFRRTREAPKRSTLARVLRRTVHVKLVLLLLIGATLGFFYLRLSAGPLSFGRLPDRVASALAARIGPGWTVALRNSSLELKEGSLALRTVGLDIRNPAGAAVVTAPDALVTVDTLSLLTGNIHPRSIEIRDVHLRASINRDGSLSFLPASEPADAAPVQSPPTVSEAPTSAPSPDTPSPVSVAVASLFDLLVGQVGVIGALDHARVTNVRLTLVDADQGERARFRRVDAVFERTPAGGRRFDATLDGPHGVWQLSGNAHAGDNDSYDASITAADAPLQDLLLLSGLSALPASAELKMSGRADAVLIQGQLKRLDGHFATGAGIVQIHDKDTSPLAVDRAALELSWDEAQRTLNIRGAALKAGATDLRLQGQLTTAADRSGWRLRLDGKDSVLAGLGPTDAPVRIDQIEAQLAAGAGLVLEKLSLRGPNLSVDASGGYGSPADPRMLAIQVNASDTPVRSVLRLWPEAVAPTVRTYLVANLRGGLANRLGVSVSFSGPDLDKALAGGPIPEKSLNVDLAISRGELFIGEGLPPLSEASVTGAVTGTRATIKASSGRVAMADDRWLALSDGSFSIPDLWPDNAEARISFKLDGGADALGSFLQVPAMRELTTLNLDPSAMKGRTDMRVVILLSINDIPKLADLPLTVTGTVSDLSVEKVLGREKLEAAHLSVAFDRGSLSIKGDGRLAGQPATIDVRQPRGAPGEAVFAFALDEAARARKGVSFGAQLTGLVPVRVSMPVGHGAGPGYRVEVDLAKAGVENLLPGWVKPSGRPGKLSFTFVEGNGSELKDLQIDSGPVQVRGSALLTADGTLDRAELTTLRLSPGDDMRAQIEKSGQAYKVSVRGNLGDAKPITRALTGAGAPTGKRGSAAERGGRDLDLDLSLNIITGFNDEALTNATIKASTRNGNLRQLQMNAKLGPATVSAQTVQRGNLPVIVVQSEDAGSMLRFLDIYRRMVGGRLILQATAGEGPQFGSLTLNDFSLRNEPALRRIIPTQSQTVTAQDRTGSVRAYRIDVNEVHFTKARVEFTRTAGRLEFRDAAVWGSQVGFTLSGYLDYAQDVADITGTFVPAYGLNNAFAQVPLFGPLLGGGQYEGLFAVNFRVSGPASAPVLTVNPLSAVAPGFLRKLFGAGTPQPDAPLPYRPDR